MTPIFWNVDTQYDFMRNDEEHKGALAIPGAKEIERNLERLTKLAERKGIPVVNTADWHHAESQELSDKPDFRTTFPPHCMMYTKGAEFVPATRLDCPHVIDWRDAAFDPARVASTRNIVLYKDKFDIFAGSPHAEGVLATLDPSFVVAYGVATNVCVNDAVLGLRRRSIPVLVPTDAIKELPGLPLDQVLRNWRDHDVRLLSTADVLTLLAGFVIHRRQWYG
ncbi:cysteine hydrolase [Candidatus Woesearchaeota archaeon]|nr:cysteine hydrolase [Candidatus Woesearchaeota archaeon]